MQKSLSKAIEHILENTEIPDYLLSFKEDLLRLASIDDEILEEELVNCSKSLQVVGWKFEEFKRALEAVTSKLEVLAASIYIQEKSKAKEGKGATENYIRSITVLDPNYQELKLEEERISSAIGLLHQTYKAVEFKKAMLEEKARIYRRQIDQSF